MPEVFDYERPTRRRRNPWPVLAVIGATVGGVMLYFLLIYLARLWCFVPMRATAAQRVAQPVTAPAPASPAGP
jgi:hypothetical protein